MRLRRVTEVAARNGDANCSTSVVLPAQRQESHLRAWLVPAGFQKSLALPSQRGKSCGNATRSGSGSPLEEDLPPTRGALPVSTGALGAPCCGCTPDAIHGVTVLGWPLAVVRGRSPDDPRRRRSPAVTCADSDLHPANHCAAFHGKSRMGRRHVWSVLSRPPSRRFRRSC